MGIEQDIRKGWSDVMRIPEQLAQLGKERMKDFQVEGFVYGTGPKNPKLMLVGEAPGETEIHNGIPFSGRAGKELMAFLADLGLTRNDVFITSAVRSRPYVWKEKRNRKGEIERKKYNRPPTQKEIVAHAPIIDYEIIHVEAPIIVTLGNTSLKRLLGKDKKVTDVHGQLIQSKVLQMNDNNEYIWSEKEFLLFPTFHPASVFYNPKLREYIESDKQKLKEWLEINNE